MGSLLYFITEAVRGCYQAKLMTFVSIVTIAVSMLLISAVVLGIVNIDAVLRRSEKEADLAVYLTQAASEDQQFHNALVDVIGRREEVKALHLVTVEEAWLRFENMYGTEILESVDENPFPASIDITLAEGFQTKAAISKLKEELALLEGVESIQYAREWLDFMETIRSYFLYASVILSLFLMLALHSMISNTIKLTIYARKELVRNMHFVGATDFFIKAPFLLEGMLQGFIGGLLCIATLYFFQLFFSHIPLYWGTNFLPLLILFIGVFFGWLGSQRAIQKFLA